MDLDFLEFCVKFYLADNELNIHQNDAVENEKARLLKKNNPKQ